MPVALNAVCPYYTMFPLSFPLRVIRQHRGRGWVVDPFCGRGTTNFAARLLARPTLGVDTSPIAVAIAQAKLCESTPERVVGLTERLLAETPPPKRVPEGAFWQLMYHSETLRDLCRLREALAADPDGPERLLLRAILLGALHGPRTKHQPSHLSNQAPRTYAPKPDYAVRFWTARNMLPPKVRILEVVKVRAARYLRERPRSTPGRILCEDSRVVCAGLDVPISLVVTSPPYYGMRTYLPDQWLRSWFLGGPEHVDYGSANGEMTHGSPQQFSDQLRDVWRGLARAATAEAKMVIRFGGIHDRQAEPTEILKESLRDSRWRLVTRTSAGDADRGKRQARQFIRKGRAPKQEYDFHAQLL